MKIKKIRKKKAASVIVAALVLFLAGNGAASLTHQCLSNFSPKKEQVENWGLGSGRKARSQAEMRHRRNSKNTMHIISEMPKRRCCT